MKKEIKWVVYHRWAEDMYGIECNLCGFRETRYGDGSEEHTPHDMTECLFIMADRFNKFIERVERTIVLVDNGMC